MNSIPIGLIALAQGCCEASLQSNTEQWESYTALTSAAVHCCCITAHLYEQQISIGAIAVTNIISKDKARRLQVLNLHPSSRSCGTQMVM